MHSMSSKTIIVLLAALRMGEKMLSVPSGGCFCTRFYDGIWKSEVTTGIVEVLLKYRRTCRPLVIQ